MRRVLIAALCAGLAGCADRHYAVNDRRMSITDIVNHVQCEVKRAWAPFGEDTRTENWVAAVTLSMQETVVNGANPVVGSHFAIKHHLPHGKVTGGLGLSKTNQETRRFEFAIDIKKIDPNICKLSAAQVKGDLGIDTVVAEALHALKIQPYSRSLNFTEAKVFGKSVQFTVTSAITGLGVTWMLRRFEGPGGFLSASRSNVNIIDISFGKTAATENISQAVRRTQDNNVKYEIQRLIAPAPAY